MPTNDFLPFATGGGANVESQTTWVSDTVVGTGFQNGIANPQQANKVLRQCSIIAAMIAQFIVDKSAQSAVDDGTTATLETNLTASINALITTFVANALGSGGTSYSPHFASVSANALDDAGAGGQFRLIAGSYGVFLRNDGGSNVSILLTNSGSPSGTYNALRPFVINLATGAVTIDGTGVGTTFGGTITVPSAVVTGNETVGGTLTAGGLSVSGSAAFATIPTGPTPGSTDNSTKLPNTSWIQTYFQPALGFTPVQQGGGAFQGSNKVYLGWDGTGPRLQIDSTDLGRVAMVNQFTLYGAPTGYQKHANGMIIQWGNNSVTGAGDYVTFPITFPTQCFGIVSNDNAGVGASGVHVTSCTPTATPRSTFQTWCRDPGASGYPASPTNLFWVAFGY